MRIANLKAVCSPDVLKLNKQSTDSERLVEAWQMYDSSHQDIFGMVAEYEVDDKQGAFLEMEEAYEAAINTARKIIKGKHRTDDVARTLRPKRRSQLTTQRKSLHNQVGEFLDCIKEDLEKVEVTQSQKALRTQCELLTKVKRRMQGAKQQTKELLGNGINNWEDLQQDEHRRCLEFDRRRWELSSLIAILGDELENLADTNT